MKRSISWQEAIGAVTEDASVSMRGRRMLPSRLHIVPATDTNERPDAAQRQSRMEDPLLKRPESGWEKKFVIFKNIILAIRSKLAQFMPNTVDENAGDSERGRGDGLSSIGRRSSRRAFRDTRPFNHNNQHHGTVAAFTSRFEHRHRRVGHRGRHSGL